MLGLSDEMTKKIPNWTWWFIIGLIAGLSTAWTVKGTVDRFEYLEQESIKYKQKADEDREEIRVEIETIERSVKKDIQVELEKIRDEFEEAKERTEYVNRRIDKKFDQAKEYTDLKTQ